MKIMDNFSKVLITTLSLSCLLLTGCKSTPDNVDEPECREANENCQEDGDDRGYDPCLVNNSLPVCKS
ncbi:hypothetical protein [Aliiglaciecola litoralis]|uniref:Lipoprotein n=1 Tax=Aliiglaciecola litoralis TaxID=582857 RepID=A0ABN1LLH2_9ALTE